MFDFLEELHHAEKKERRTQQREQKAQRSADDAAHWKNGEEDADEERPHHGVHRTFLDTGCGALREIPERLLRCCGLVWLGRLGHVSI